MTGKDLGQAESRLGVEFSGPSGVPALLEAEPSGGGALGRLGLYELGLLGGKYMGRVGKGEVSGLAGILEKS